MLQQIHGLGFILTSVLMCFSSLPTLDGRRQSRVTKANFYLVKMGSVPPLDYNELTPGSKSSIEGAGFDSQKNTVFMTHGFSSSRKGKSISFLNRAYVKMNVNYIFVDWSNYSGSVGLTNAVHAYETAVHHVPDVAKEITRFIYAMMNWGMVVPERVHLVGHSLGAQMMGRVGDNFQRMTAASVGGRKIFGRITGLDPAGPCFGPGKPGRLMTPSDAVFVDAVHSDWGYLGIDKLVGTVDFLINKGKSPQPYCGNWIAGDWTTCSHSYATYVFATSMTVPRVGCKLYGDEAKGPAGVPKNYGYPLNCKEPAQMGPYVSLGISGTYTVNTTDFKTPTPPKDDQLEAGTWSFIACGSSRGGNSSQEHKFPAYE